MPEQWTDIVAKLTDDANKIIRFMEESGIDTRDGALACGLIYAMCAREDISNHEIALMALVDASVMSGTRIIVKSI